jgi:hypothetical protein
MPSWGCAATGSLISCARAASAGSTATHFIENNARYVEYCGAGECVGLYYNLHQLVSDAGKPRLGPMSSAVLRRVANRARRRLFAGGRWIRTIGSATEKLRSVRAPRVDMRQWSGRRYTIGFGSGSLLASLLLHYCREVTRSGNTNSAFPHVTLVQFDALDVPQSNSVRKVCRRPSIEISFDRIYFQSGTGEHKGYVWTGLRQLGARNRLWRARARR